MGDSDIGKPCGAFSSSPSNDLLDFVFLDDASRPYRITMYGGEPWLFYWHADGHWVTLRRVTQPEIWELKARRLPDEQAALYHEKSNAGSEGLT